MQNRKRIILMTSSYPGVSKDLRAAAGVFVRDFAHELAKRAEVTVLTQRIDSGPSIVLEEGVKVVRFTWAGMERPLSTLSMPRDIGMMISAVFGGVRAAWRYARQNDIDYTLALWTVPSGGWAFALKLRSSIPWAVWCLGSDIWDYGRRPILRHIVRFLLQQAEVRFADGFKLKGDVEALCGRRCRFLPSTRRLKQDSVIRPDIAKRKRNYLFIGRYHPNKGPDILIEAIALLPSEIKKQVCFHFFGGGMLEADLRQAIEKERLADLVKLNGYIDENESAAYLRVCDALIIPSRMESIPVVFSDALQVHCPLIVSDVGDMGDLMRRYEAGQVVQPESPEDLKQAILTDIAVGPEKYKPGLKQLGKLFDLERSVSIFLRNVQ